MEKTIVTLLAAAGCLLCNGHAAAQSYITEISTAEELAELAAQVNGGTDYSSYTVTLTADIDLGGYDAWTPIGVIAYDRHFNGTFDGNGHRITGLKVNAQATETGFVAGLFGVVGSAGTVKDLTVVTAEVRINKADIVDGEPVVEHPDMTCYIGSITGQNLGNIVGCANRGVSVYGNWNEARVGGIAGENSGKIQNCYNLGEVYTGNYANNILGGIAGQNSSGGKIQNCFVRATIDEDKHALHVGPICGNNSGTLSGCFYMNGTSDDGTVNLVLNNDAGNELTPIYGQTKNILLDGRTIYSDGAWNTICLPFDLPAGASGRSPIAGASVKELDAATSGFDPSTGLLTLNFTDATSIKAGRPYIVRWDEAITDDLSSPVFLGVEVSDAPAATVSATNVDFVGCYSPVVLSGGDKGLLYLGSGNTLYYPSADMSVNSCRAYFHVNPGAEVKDFRLDFGGHGTGIDATTYTNYTNADDLWYTLDGRRLAGKPADCGIYINKGKKVVIK